MTYVDHNSSKEKAVSGIASIAVVGVVGYALVTGLAMKIVQIPGVILVNHRYADPTPPPPKPIPRQQTTKSAAKATAPIDRPVIDISIIPPRTGPDILPPIDDHLVTGDGQGVSRTQQQTPDRSSGVQARGDPGEWVTTDDYPSIALRTGKEGRTIARLDIGIDGRPTGCTVAQLSGSDELDRTTCSTLMRRAKFTPARNAQGDAIPSSYTSSVLWRIPSE